VDPSISRDRFLWFTCLYSFRDLYQSSYVLMFNVSNEFIYLYWVKPLVTTKVTTRMVNKTLKMWRSYHHSLLWKIIKKNKNERFVKPYLGFGNRSHVRKVLASYNTLRPKTIPLIKYAKECYFLENLFFPKKTYENKEKKFEIFLFKHDNN